MQGFQMGDKKSFELIFQIFYPALCLYALKITGDQFSAEDIAEESFVKIWQRHANFSHIKVLKSYLYTTVRNASINWSKQNKKQQQFFNKEYSDYKKPIQTKLENLIEVETFRELYCAIENLSPQCKKIITMLFIEGKRTKQVAKELQLSHSHVSTQRKRGLVLLRKIIPLLFCILIAIY